jgi:two-component system CheB/CheR fusion protein
MTSTASRVVGIGASAGGIAALRRFFEQMPVPNGFAFIVALHLAPDRRSLLTEILGRWTPMRVVTATDGDVLQADRVYVVPAGTVAVLRDRAIHLRDLTMEERHHASGIDAFFDTLASVWGKRAIGIVLSGTGHDGALGLKAIRGAGGMTMAQGSAGGDPEYPGMPDSAIATGAVDVVVPVEDMPRILVNALQAPLEAVSAGTQLNQWRLDICRLLAAQTGHDFSQYKDQTFLRRVRRRMQMLGLGTYVSYIERLAADHDEASRLFRDLLIGVTSFFRDAETFDVLATRVIPRLFHDKGPDQSVRIWIAGCATGEEAYSVAILLREYAARLEAPPRLQVFATDLDEFAIGSARAGRYPANLLRGVDEARRRRWFTVTEGGYVVTKDIRNICTFSAHSLIRDPPFSSIDLVSCRNLLIYMDNELQARVIPIFHYALVSSGIPLLGSAETVSRFESLFETINKKHRIFRRKDVASQLPPLSIRTMQMAGHDQKAGKSAPVADDVEGRAILRARNRILDTYAPAFVVVDGNGEVLYYSNRTGRFFEPAPGPPSKSLYDMARPDFRLGLRASLRRVVDSGERTEQYLGDAVDARTAPITLIVEPLASNTDGLLLLVVFMESRKLAVTPPVNDVRLDPRELAGLLERENRDLREQLQSIREEHETALEELRSANEELHSVNEELQSSNEELETSREEIQSINEEMSTVNAQLTAKVDELDRANSDLKNLFESTTVATIFLDRHLVIRAYTPEVAGIYNLIPSDVGRPLFDIVNRLDYRDLRTDVAQVLTTLEPLERSVSRDDGQAHYLMRVLPYRCPDSSIDGSLITFIEVTSIVQAEQHQRLLVDELNHRVKNMLTVVISLATQTLRRSHSIEEFSDAFLGRIHALTKAYELLSLRSWEDVLLGDVVREELRPFMSLADHNIVLSGPDVALDARGALAVGLAIHELSTNAAKYGALSVPKGDVAVTWTIATTGDRPYFSIDWIEHNGPPVAMPVKPGFGIVLIERGVAHDLGGEAQIEFLRTGVHARLRAPQRRDASKLSR